MSTRSTIWYSERFDLHVYREMLDDWVWLAHGHEPIMRLWPTRRRVQLRIGHWGRVFCWLGGHAWAYDGLRANRMTWRCLTCQKVSP